MKLLITGACGLLGTELSLQARAMSHDVVGVDNGSRYTLLGEQGIRAQEDNWRMLANAGVELHARSIETLDVAAIRNVDAVVHAAAQVCHSRKGIHDNPWDDYSINIGGTLKLLELARLHKVPFLFISSSKLYGENFDKEPWRSAPGGVDEHCPIGDQTHITFFGASKAAADLFCQMYAQKYGLTVGILRPGCFTGPFSLATEAQNWAPYLIHCALRRKRFTLFGYEGKQVRDLLHVDDLADACLSWLSRPQTGVWNIGGGPENTISLRAAITTVEQLTGRAVDVRFGERRPGDIFRLVLDSGKFASAYGWRPHHDVQSIFEELVEAERMKANAHRADEA